MRLKSPHKAIQKALIASLPGAKLETSFPKINRIADVVYFPKKIIFEVQCSPISLQEVQKRNRDYASLGYTVIWVLHDRHYNKGVLSPAELYLRKNLSYYTSITPFGHGFFYDQLEFFQGNKRIYRGKPHNLKNFLPQTLKKIPRPFPKSLQEKLSKLPLYLQGDVTDTLIITKGGKVAKQLERTFSSPHKGWLINYFEHLLKKNSGPECSSFSHKP